MVDGVRDVHQQLLIGITAEFGLRIQSLVPCLLADLASRTRGALVQSIDGVKVDLFVEAVLQSWSDVVRMIVNAMRMAVAVTMTFVFVVAMRHDACGALMNGG